MKYKICLQTMPENINVSEYIYILPNDINKIDISSAEEIRVGQLLDNIDNRQEAINVLISKLRIGGILTLEGIDIIEISKQILLGNISIDIANRLIYERRSMDSLCRSIPVLQNIGCEIIEKRLDMQKCLYYIKVKKQ